MDRWHRLRSENLGGGNVDTARLVRQALRNEIALFHGELKGWKRLSLEQTIFLSEAPASDIPWASEQSPAPVLGPSEDVYPLTYCGQSKASQGEASL